MDQPPVAIVHWRLTFESGETRAYRTVADAIRDIYSKDKYCMLTQSSFSSCIRSHPKQNGVLHRLLALHKIEKIERVK